MPFPSGLGESVIFLFKKIKAMKFTLEQITEAQRKSTNFPLFIQNLRILGVADFVTSVSDGYTDYFDMAKESINSEPTHDFLVAEKADRAKFLKCLKLHQSGATDFTEFCKDCAENGIDCWIVDLRKMTCIYYDKTGQEILVEKIPSASY